MKIKDYKCKCGSEDFFFANKGNQKGIYCSYCGKWLKWAGKDEQNLDMKQESFINKPCVSKGACHEDKIKALDKIREEIKALLTEQSLNIYGMLMYLQLSTNTRWKAGICNDTRTVNRNS